MMPFEEAEKEMEYALEHHAESVINAESFTNMLKTLKLIQRLHRPSKQIERSVTYPFLHKVFWSGILTSEETG